MDSKRVSPGEPCMRMIFSILMVSVSCWSAAAKPLQVGSVAAVRGDPTAQLAEQPERALRVQEAVFEGDLIRTGKRGRVQIVLDDRSIIFLGRETELSIDRFRFDSATGEGEAVTSVRKGVFRVMGGLITKVAPENFRTDTPTATIGIRGSFYMGDYCGELLRVLFLGGTGVFVENEFGHVDLSRVEQGAAARPGSAPFLMNFSPDVLRGMENSLAAKPREDEGEDDGSNNDNGKQPAPERMQENKGSPEPKRKADMYLDQDTEGNLQLSLPADEAVIIAREGASGQITVAGELDANSLSAVQLTLSGEDADTIQEVLGVLLSGAREDVPVTGGYQGATMASFSQRQVLSGLILTGALDGTVTGQVADVEGVLEDQVNNHYPFDISLEMDRYVPGSTYQPIDITSTDVDDLWIGLSRDFSLGTLGTIVLDYSYITDGGPGEFAVLLGQAEDMDFSELMYVGIEATESDWQQADDILKYRGYIHESITQDQLVSAVSTVVDQEIREVSVYLNRVNRRIVGFISVPDEKEQRFSLPDLGGGTLPSVMSVSLPEQELFIAEVDENGQIINVTLLGSFLSDDGTPLALGDEDTVSGEVYGSALQGLGLSWQGVDITRLDTEAVVASISANAGLMLTGSLAEADTSLSQWSGHIVGIAEDMADPYETASGDTRILMSSLDSGLSLSMDRAEGTLSGSAGLTDLGTLVSGSISESALTIDTLTIGGTEPSAVVSTRIAAAVVSADGAVSSGNVSGSLKSAGNYLVTGTVDEWGDGTASAPNPPEWMQWGYWEIAFDDPDTARSIHVHQPGAIWVAAENQINDISHVFSDVTVRYEGPAQCIRSCTADQSQDQLFGCADINVNFGREPGSRTFSGDLTFAQGALTMTTSGNLTAQGLQGVITSIQDCIGNSSASSVTPAASLVSGTFYDPVDSVGVPTRVLGVFAAETEGLSPTKYVGAFGGEVTPQ